jgi:hypothetical protein
MRRRGAIRLACLEKRAAILDEARRYGETLNNEEQRAKKCVRFR